MNEDNKCEHIGDLVGDKWDKMHEQSRRVYGTDGLAPTLHTCGGGNLETKVAIFDEQNNTFVKDGLCNTLTTDGSSPKHNGRVVEYQLSDAMKRYINSKDDKYKVGDKNLVVNRKIACTKSTREGSTRADASDYISVDLPEGQNIAGLDCCNYRIRKLTPRECFRLMGVKDEDFDKIAQHQSNSKLYHLAGDSIVTNVLMAIFKEMINGENYDNIGSEV